MDHEIQKNRGVGKNHPLDRRVADVPLMPKRYILKRRLGISANEAREAENVFGPNWVSFMRHGRRAFLSLKKGFFRFQDLSALKMPDFGRDALETCRHNRQMTNIFR